MFLPFTEQITLFEKCNRITAVKTTAAMHWWKNDKNKVQMTLRVITIITLRKVSNRESWQPHYPLILWRKCNISPFHQNETRCIESRPAWSRSSQRSTLEVTQRRQRVGEPSPRSETGTSSTRRVWSSWGRSRLEHPSSSLLLARGEVHRHALFHCNGLLLLLLYSVEEDFAPFSANLLMNSNDVAIYEVRNKNLTMLPIRVAGGRVHSSRTLSCCSLCIEALGWNKSPDKMRITNYVLSVR